MEPPPDSSNSPRSATEAQLEDHAPPSQPSQVQPLQKLRLMCSYGGHIVPRPHDKSLCYVGGDTRIVMVDRHLVSLSSLNTRLSSTLLNGRQFVLKYQLPNEDLDSLISVTTDEDLENMLDEYDRTASAVKAGGTAASRLRLFLFPLKPESTQSLLDNGVVKGGDDWFISELNGAHHLNRGFSDSVTSSVNCLLGLDDPQVISGGEGNIREVEGLSANSGGGGGKKQDVHSVPDSPMMETTSSFGSTSSSPSLANLPPIKVHVAEDQKVIGIEEQFAQVNLVGSGGGVKSDEGFLVISSPPPMPVSIVPIGAVGTAEYRDRVYSDDERSDHGGVGYRKQQITAQVQSQTLTQTQTQTQAVPQTQPPAQPPVQPQRLPSNQDLTSQKSSAGVGIVDLPSPDSVSSDSSLGNAMNRMKPVLLQEASLPIPSIASRAPPNIVDGKVSLSDLGMRVPTQQGQDSAYVLQPQFDQQMSQTQQQFIHPGPHYIHHPGGPVPMSAYYPVSVYPPQQQQQHQPQQYPVYFMHTRPQAYNLPVQHNSINETGTPLSSSHQQAPPSATMVAPQSAYIPMRSAPVTTPEMTTSAAYRTAPSGTPQLVQVPSGQHPQQYIAYSQVHHPTQSIAPTSLTTSNYGYDILDPSHGKVFYTPTMAAQYQTMTSAAAAALPENSPQISADNIKQQTRTSQPI